ncbi:hypothetical protein AB0O87_05795 [Microbacterium sp. NPDC076768]|uniref:hypothetical protein n=1 Tax=Microbacterium sp. NPDC076768 TaxID=3154858 RepID=UPI003446911F
MGSFAFGLLVLQAYFLVVSLSVKRGVVRVSKAGPLRFLSPPTNRAMLVLLVLVCLVPGVIVVISMVFDLPMADGRSLRSGPLGLAIIAIGGLGALLWSVRTPAGLTLDERGLRGVREHTSFDVEWDGLVRAESGGKMGMKLTLHFRDRRRPVVVGGPQIGSDPAVVAAVIEYYRLHPAERTHLSDGPGAIRVVEARASC